MRLLILEDQVEMGGVQFSTLNLLAGLQEFAPQVEVLVLLPGEGPFTEACRKANYRFQLYEKFPLHSSSLSFSKDALRVPHVLGLLKNLALLKKQVRTLQALVQDFAPQVVLTKGMGAHINGGRLCKKMAIPCVWHLQDHISPRYGGLYQRYFGYLVKKYSQASIADGQPIKDLLPKAQQQNCQVVFNGVPLKEYHQPHLRAACRKELGLEPNDYAIGHLARLGPWKGQHLLLEAFAQYAVKNKKAHLIFIGSPLFKSPTYEHQLKSRTEALKLSKRVHFLGYRTNLGYLFAGLDSFMYPSVEKDTSPLALISALAAGLPAGVSNISGLTEMVEGCAGARLFPNRNVAAMQEIMAYFASEKNRQPAREANQAWAQAHFSVAAYTRAIVKQLDPLAQS